MILVNKKNKRYVNKNVIAKVSHNKYKDVLQSKKSFGGFGKKKGGGGGGVLRGVHTPMQTISQALSGDFQFVCDKMHR